MNGVPTSLALIGLGSVGRRLARDWKRAGIRVLAHSPSAKTRERARAEGLEVQDSLEQAIAPASAIVLCVGDAELGGAVEGLARALARRAPALPSVRPGSGEPLVCLHTSGSQGRSILDPLARLGCDVGSLHPLAAFAPEGPGPRLEGAWCAIGGDGRAREVASALVGALGAKPLFLNETDGAAERYHAAASLLSNGAVALTAVALDLARRACTDPEQSRHAFLSLLRATLTNLERDAPERALTGPVSRADVETVRRHLAVLHGDAETLALYRLLSRRMLVLAVRAGRIDSGQAGALERALGQ